MKRLLIMMVCGLLALGACGDDDDPVAVTEDEASAESGDEAGGTDDEPGEESAADETTSAPPEATTAVPASLEICDAVRGPMESIYSTALEVEDKDGSYPACDIDMAEARVVVSAFALSEVGGDFDAYVDSVSETVTGLEPVDGIGDAAVADDAGHAYVLLGDVVYTVSRVFNEVQGDPADIEVVAAAVATALG